MFRGKMLKMESRKNKDNLKTVNFFRLKGIKQHAQSLTRRKHE